MLLCSFGGREVQDNGDKVLMLQTLHPSVTRSNHALHCVIFKAEKRVLWVKDRALANSLIISALWCNLLHFRGQKILLFMRDVSKTDALAVFRGGGNTKPEEYLGTLPLCSFKAAIIQRSFFMEAHAFSLSTFILKQICCKWPRRGGEQSSLENTHTDHRVAHPAPPHLFECLFAQSVPLPHLMLV